MKFQRISDFTTKQTLLQEQVAPSYIRIWSSEHQSCNLPPAVEVLRLGPPPFWMSGPFLLPSIEKIALVFWYRNGWWVGPYFNSLNDFVYNWYAWSCQTARFYSRYLALTLGCIGSGAHKLKLKQLASLKLGGGALRVHRDAVILSRANARRSLNYHSRCIFTTTFRYRALNSSYTVLYERFSRFKVEVCV